MNQPQPYMMQIETWQEVACMLPTTHFTFNYVRLAHLGFTCIVEYKIHRKILRHPETIFA